MRELKFRVWDTKNKKFMNPQYLGEHIFMDLQTGEVCGFNYDELNIGEDGKYIIQQYTGLKDKNGVELYLGDQLNIETCLSEGPYKSTITWGDGAFICERELDKNGNKLLNEFCLLAYCCAFSEKFGNILENNELTNKL